MDIPACPKCLLPHGRRTGPRNPKVSGACPICGKPNPVTRRRYCRDCQNQYVRGHRANYRQLSPQERERRLARLAVYVYVKRGILVREPCIACDSPDVEAHHHRGYEWQLDVLWVCKPHHRDLHAGRSLSVDDTSP